MWRATDTADGPATLHLRTIDPHTISARAWGPGAECTLEQVPDLVGADDELPPLAGHPLVSELADRLPGLRVGRTGAVMEALVPTVLRQRVIGAEAAQSYKDLVRAAGRRVPEPVPADCADDPEPPPALVAPTRAALDGDGSFLEVPSLGCRAQARRDHPDGRCAGAPFPRTEGSAEHDVRRRLSALPGIGPWTVNTVAMVALGDPDAVSVGDYWLKHIVSYALAAEPRGSDERMLELLEPWRGQRGRVCRLIMCGAPPLPRFGPRLPLRNLAAH